MELRDGNHGPPGIHIWTQKPLAIFVLSKRLQLWQTGRSESKIAAKLARHPGVEIDILRQYLMLFGWVKGVDLLQAADQLHMGETDRAKLFDSIGSLVVHELELKGYRVMDMKPAHIIVRLRNDGSSIRNHHDHLAYALIDYELMERTEEHEKCVRSQNRHLYLQHMARRFEIPSGSRMPAHLKEVNLLGIDYVYGHAESTGGAIWVVGKDPDLFNFFLPERWRRTPNIPISCKNQVFWTCTKDNINLVWRVSRIGETPNTTEAGDRGQDILAHGFNSPFEEFAHALEIGKRGLKTIYPRAIYMTRHLPRTEAKISDSRRFVTLAGLRTPENQPVLSKNREYITLWGFWNGPDEVLAAKDGDYYECLSVKSAFLAQLITESELNHLLNDTKTRLHEIGFEHLNLKGEHLLLSITPDQTVVCGPEGDPDIRLCNFEFIRPLS